MALKLALALALVDIVSHGIKAGQLIEATPDTITALTKVGDVDPHKDAVAYARSQGAPAVRSTIELAAAERQAQEDALRVRIAELEDLAAKAGGEPTQAALHKELGDRRAELHALQQT